MSHLDQMSTQAIGLVSWLKFHIWPCPSSSFFGLTDKKENNFYWAWEVQVKAKLGSVTTHTGSYVLTWSAVIETDNQKFNTTQCTWLCKDKTLQSLVVNIQQCNLTVEKQWAKGCDINIQRPWKQKVSKELKSTNMIHESDTICLLLLCDFKKLRKTSYSTSKSALRQ